MNDYDRIAQVICYLNDHHREQPSLAQLASHVGLSPFHFHRLFSRWAGITPKDFLQCLSLKSARDSLRAGTSVLDAALDAGLSGPGRLHDLCVKLEAASPGEVKSGGDGWTIRAGFADSPFGICLIARGPRGICHLSFVESRDETSHSAVIHADWPRARISWDFNASSVADTIFSERPCPTRESPLRVFVRGTKFQVRVWRALLSIPAGVLTSYGQLAATLGDRNAARAVGSAVGKNQLACLIPCHRVIRESGVFGEYRWGSARKQAIVAWESAGRTLMGHKG